MSVADARAAMCMEIIYGIQQSGVLPDNSFTQMVPEISTQLNTIREQLRTISDTLRENTEEIRGAATQTITNMGNDALPYVISIMELTREVVSSASSIEDIFQIIHDQCIETSLENTHGALAAQSQ